MIAPTYRLIVVAASLAGAAGVALSAAAAHGERALTGTASSFLLVHAAALLAIGLTGRGRTLALAGAVLFIGVALFTASLAVLDFTGSRLFPLSAPIGGGLLIVGWLLVGASVIFHR